MNPATATEPCCTRCDPDSTNVPSTGVITSCPQGFHVNVATATEPCCTRCDKDLTPEAQEIEQIKENMETATPEMKTKVFNFYDKNKDGKVTATEIKEIDQYQFGKDETIAGIMETVTKIDKNGDQAIELNELIEWTPTPEGD